MFRFALTLFAFFAFSAVAVAGPVKSRPACANGSCGLSPASVPFTFVEPPKTTTPPKAPPVVVVPMPVKPVVVGSAYTATVTTTRTTVVRRHRLFGHLRARVRGGC